MWKVSPDSTTTIAKNGLRSKNHGLDHAIANTCMNEIVVNSVIRYDLAMSDHFPVLTTIRQSEHVQHVWMWPKLFLS